jgi:hypothetical protein
VRFELTTSFGSTRASSPSPLSKIQSSSIRRLLSKLELTGPTRLSSGSDGFRLNVRVRVIRVIYFFVGAVTNSCWGGGPCFFISSVSGLLVGVMSRLGVGGFNNCRNGGSGSGG